MCVEKGIEVDGTKVGTVDEVEATDIFVHITTPVTGSDNLNHRVKERHHEEEKLKMFVIVNTPARVNIPIQKSDIKELVTESKPESKPHLKRGRPVGAKDIAPRKRKIKKIALEVAHAPEEANIPEVNNGYISNQISPCVSIKKSQYDFVIIVVYVDDLNLVGTTTEVDEAVIYLKIKFEMKDLGRAKYCLVTTPMVVRSLEPDKDPFRPRADDEEVLGPEIPYLDITRNPTVMFEDNTACIDQLKEGYIKGDGTKHISPKFFYTHEFQKNGKIDVQQIRLGHSCRTQLEFEEGEVLLLEWIGKVRLGKRFGV
ncbi:hypothetical protein AgCh_003193 [Apium graveolens]